MNPLKKKITTITKQNSFSKYLSGRTSRHMQAKNPARCFIDLLARSETSPASTPARLAATLKGKNLRENDKASF